METITSQNVRHSLKKFGNPYVYIDSDENVAKPNLSLYQSLKSGGIAASKLLLQNQHAYADENGGSSAAELRHTPFIEFQKKDFYTDSEIEKVTRKIHRKMWVDRDKIWKNFTLKNPIEILDPAIALSVLGFDVDVYETLGQYRKNDSLIEVAGIIDHDLKKVSLAGRQHTHIRNFTAAHELGHAVLHEAQGVHRDKALDGTLLSREPIELQADTFAKYYLMPQKLLTHVFKDLFLTSCFSLNEETSFALLGDDFVNLERKFKTRRELSRVLASTCKYNGKQFPSLATQFKVSIEAMAIRLEELNLIDK